MASTANMASTKQYGSFTIPFVPLDVRYEENKEDFCRVISTLYPKFDVSSLIFKEFTGGITNQVIGVFLKDEEGCFVVRLYGRDTERFVCRKSEVIANQVAAACNVGQKIVCLFNNGSCCELLPGASLSPEDFREWGTAELIARTMARMHVKGEWPEQDAKPLLKTRFLSEDWLSLVPQVLDSESRTRKLKEIMAEFGDLRVASSDLLSILDKAGSPVVFCHNDLLCGNVVVNRKAGTVKFIDMEFSGPNYRGFDVADHFCEFAGIDNPDYTLFPDKEFQCKWLRAYLEEAAELKGEDPAAVKEADVEKMYIEVSKFVPAAHLVWGINALFQSKYSLINFDYLKYARVRLNEYRRHLEFLKQYSKLM